MKEKLEPGLYYIIHRKLGETIDYKFDINQWRSSSNDDVLEVLGKVPSYEEALAMKDCLKMVWKAAEREVKLKKLLKECKERLIYCTISTQDVQSKIDQVLADNKIQANQ